MKRTKNGHRIISTGIDARGNKYWLVHYNGGSKYIWEAGHVWAGFTNANKPFR